MSDAAWSASETHSDARLQAGLRQVDLQSRMPAAVELVTQVGRAAVLLVGGVLVLRGRLTLGVLLVLLAYLQQLYGPMKSLARLSSVIAKGQAGAERVEEVLRATTVVRERPDAVEAPRAARRGGAAGRALRLRPGRGRCSTGCRCTCQRARWWRSRAAPGPASRPSSASSRGCTT